MNKPNPLANEEEYFARENLIKIKKLAYEKRHKLADEEKERLKNLHWMRCAKCGSELHEILFHGVTINQCFTCGGVFLDKKDLEKLAGKESHFFQSVVSLFRTE